jgi:hypothetical protein
MGTALYILPVAYKSFTLATVSSDSMQHQDPVIYLIEDTDLECPNTGSTTRVDQLRERPERVF